MNALTDADGARYLKMPAVTVLFCDIANSTPLTEKLGVEAMHALLQRFFALGLEAVHRYEETVNEFLGGGFMALFGAPVAHEDDARRSVLSPLGIRRLIRDRQGKLGLPVGNELQVRMGLNTGWRRRANPSLARFPTSRCRMRCAAHARSSNRIRQAMFERSCGGRSLVLTSPRRKSAPVSCACSV